MWYLFDVYHSFFLFASKKKYGQLHVIQHQKGAKLPTKKYKGTPQKYALKQGEKPIGEIKVAMHGMHRKIERKCISNGCKKLGISNCKNVI